MFSFLSLFFSLLTYSVRTFPLQSHNLCFGRAKVFFWLFFWFFCWFFFKLYTVCMSLLSYELKNYWYLWNISCILWLVVILASPDNILFYLKIVYSLSSRKLQLIFYRHCLFFFPSEVLVIMFEILEGCKIVSLYII